MVSESDFALVVFFGVLSFLCTSTVLYKILAAFTFSSSSIVAIYRMFSVQLVLISTVLFSMITGAKRTQWRCALSAFAVMYCNLSICASVLLLTKINSDLIKGKVSKVKNDSMRRIFLSVRNLMSSSTNDASSSKKNAVAFKVDQEDLCEAVAIDDGNAHHRHKYKTWMFALTFVLPLVALFPLITDTYKYDSQFENRIVPFCSYYYQDRWGLRWVIFELYCVELLLVLATVGICLRVLHGVHTRRIVLDDSQGEGGGISRTQLTLMALYPLVLFTTWIPQYVWLETPFEYGIPTVYPEWVLKLCFIFWMMSGIIYSLVFALQYSSLLLFEEWVDSLESTRVSYSVNKKASVEKQIVSFLSAIKMTNNETAADAAYDDDDDLRLSTVIRPSEYARRRQLVLERDTKRNFSIIAMPSIKLSSIKHDIIKRLTGLGIYGLSGSNIKSDAEMAASAINALASSNEEGEIEDELDMGSIARPPSDVLNTADIYKGSTRSTDGETLVFSAVSPLYKGNT